MENNYRFIAIRFNMNDSIERRIYNKIEKAGNMSKFIKNILAKVFKIEVEV